MRTVKNEIISMAKGIAIILMVVGHSPTHSFIKEFVYLFHMSLFFFLAGYCFKIGYLDDFKKFSKKRFIGLYWPFIKWNLIFLVAHNFFAAIYIIDQPAYQLSDYLNRFIELCMMRRSELLLGGFWFLPALFFTSFIGWGVIKLSKGKDLKLLIIMSIMIIFCILGNIYFKNHNYNITGLQPTNILLYGVIFIFGHYIAKHKLYIMNKVSPILTHSKSGKSKIVLLIIILASICILISSNLFLSVQSYMTWEIPIFLIGASCGITMVLLICSVISNKRVKIFLVYTGNNTLSILALHFSAFKLVSYIIIILFELELFHLSEFPFLKNPPSESWILYSVVGVIMPLIITYQITKLSDLKKINIKKI